MLLISPNDCMHSAHPTVVFSLKLASNWNTYFRWSEENSKLAIKRLNPKRVNLCVRDSWLGELGQSFSTLEVRAMGQDKENTQSETSNFDFDLPNESNGVDAFMLHVNGMLLLCTFVSSPIARHPSAIALIAASLVFALFNLIFTLVFGLDRTWKRDNDIRACPKLQFSQQCVRTTSSTSLGRRMENASTGSSSSAHHRINTRCTLCNCAMDRADSVHTTQYTYSTATYSGVNAIYKIYFRYSVPMPTEPTVHPNECKCWRTTG